MQRVIDRALYDTEAAEQIAKRVLGGAPDGFSFHIGTLYQTDDGEYFLHELEGEKTKYVQKLEDGRIHEQEIVPLSEEEALDWCEEMEVDPEVIVDEFGHLIET